jgi:hypothetical protein
MCRLGALGGTRLATFGARVRCVKVERKTGTNPKFFDGAVVEDACGAEVEAHAVA